ncbi:MAG: hypothetical protein K0S44_2784 [Bacteroidetes bacterium]|nr:hypothetical protein [Bacteroidota bacterium]
MENFIVSARKYRPATFNTVVGQGHITNTAVRVVLVRQPAQGSLQKRSTAQQKQLIQKPATSVNHANLLTAEHP